MRRAALLAPLAGLGLLAAGACEVRPVTYTASASLDAAVACDGAASCPAVPADACPGGGRTTVSGQVFAPNGTLPLYDAVVYVPGGPIDPFPSSVSCDRCSRVTGNPLVVTHTGADGRFTLADVPPGRDVPLVIQLGRWRRQLVLPEVTACGDTPVPPALARLPRNRAEGDIPRLAIATGAADPFECLLLKLGLDANEIGDPDQAPEARVHFYRATNAPGLDLVAPAPKATQLYASLARLLDYDAVLLPCEGGAFDKSRVDGTPLPLDPRALLAQYLDLGGRVFATHLSYAWLTYPGSPFNRVALPARADGQWPVGQPDEFDSTIVARLSTTFAKGAAFARWLGFAGATSAPGTLGIAQGRHDLTGVDPALARPWATYDFPNVHGGPGVMHFTLNTPLEPPKDPSGEPAYCGRLVFSDFHVTAGALRSAQLPFPVACQPGELTDQEKALAFMLFDLTSCVQADVVF